MVVVIIPIFSADNNKLYQWSNRLISATSTTIKTTHAKIKNVRMYRRSCGLSCIYCISKQNTVVHKPKSRKTYKAFELRKAKEACTGERTMIPS